MPNNPDKSNAEVAREIVNAISSCEDQDCLTCVPCDEKTVNALTRAQSQLAKEVLAEMSTMAGGTHGGDVVVVARDAAVERLRAIDDFAKLLFDEAKALLEKGRSVSSTEAETAFFHASILLGFCSLEAHWPHQR